ncbi:sensor histidine kinase [Radicibacter daui]|uniref:sensor histidine kinase n=1 Tax=Radicibacter daui TaxID=3064829 RepID=UPI004046FCB7
MISIRRRLLGSILSVLAIVIVILAVAMFFSVRREMDELYDQTMEQVALAIARTGINDELNLNDALPKRGRFTGEDEFLIQIWRGDTLAYSSHASVKFPMQAADGSSYTYFNRQRWNFYRLTTPRGVIQIAQNLHKRHGVIREIYNVLLWPILIQFPILAVLIWLSLTYGFSALSRVSRLIERRSASYLEPISRRGVPVEVLPLVDPVNELLARLRAAFQSQRHFTADAAHELRTPLTAVQLQLDILRRAGNEEERKDAQAGLEKAVARLGRLTDQLLELARQEPETLSRPFEPVDLGHVLADCIDHLRPLAEAREISLSLVSPGSLRVRGSAEQLGTLFGNLVNNAILYTPGQGRVEVSAHDAGETIVVEVNDTGIGIAEKDRLRIFDRFFRIGRSEASGSGLGLSIVKAIADLHDIGIEVLGGNRGVGTRFVLTLQKLHWPGVS